MRKSMLQDLDRQKLQGPPVLKMVDAAGTFGIHRRLTARHAGIRRTIIPRRSCQPVPVAGRGTWCRSCKCCSTALTLRWSAFTRAIAVRFLTRPGGPIDYDSTWNAPRRYPFLVTHAMPVLATTVSRTGVLSVRFQGIYHLLPRCPLPLRLLPPLIAEWRCFSIAIRYRCSPNRATRRSPIQTAIRT